MAASRPPSSEPERILTPRLRLELGLLASGLGRMFLSGRFLPAPFRAGIASGISLAVAGLVLAVVEALRES